MILGTDIPLDTDILSLDKIEFSPVVDTVLPVEEEAHHLEQIAEHPQPHILMAHSSVNVDQKDVGVYGILLHLFASLFWRHFLETVFYVCVLYEFLYH